MTLDLLPSAPEALDILQPGDDRFSTIWFPNGSRAVLAPSTGLVPSVLNAAYDAWQESRNGSTRAGNDHER